MSTKSNGPMKRRIAIAVIFGLGFAVTASAQASRGIDVGVPAYVWPNDPFIADLKDPVKTPIPPAVVILNIENGDGNVALMDADADALRARTLPDGEHVRVIGYVWSNYAMRPIADVKSSIDHWLGARNGSVHVDGIFVDQVTSACGPSVGSNQYRDYYRQIREYVWTKLPNNDLVVNNPGNAITDCYLEARHDTADIFVTFEGSKTSYLQAPSAANGWVGWTGGNVIVKGQYQIGTKYPSSRFWHLVYDTGAGDYQQIIDLAFDRWAGTVETTDDVMPNPWDVKPSYLTQAIRYSTSVGPYTR
ncbi:MAG: hypothetical protein HY308_02535 [Gammaproteobacteria bacterium]|nr:hypothetical protein [Gammaproteobacteria bacterium]